MTRTVRVVHVGYWLEVEGNQTLCTVEVGSAGRLKPKHERLRPTSYKACATVCAFSLIALFTSCGGLAGVDSNPPITITMTNGSPQSTTVGVAFTAPLIATVTTGGAPTSGLSVTFTAPTTGASGTFAGGAPSEIDATDAGGVARSSAFKANPTAGPYTVTAVVTGASTPAMFALTNIPSALESVTSTGGTPQVATVGSAFSAPLAATVLDSGSNPVSGVSVTFTAPTTGASGKFANGMSTESDTTDASGVASSSPFTASPIAGGPYTVAATVTGIANAANFILTNTVAVCQ
jgi:hypothetical protein